MYTYIHAAANAALASAAAGVPGTHSQKSVALFVYIQILHFWELVEELHYTEYKVATISRLLKIIRLFCKRASSKRLYSAKEPIILRSLLIVATPNQFQSEFHSCSVLCCRMRIWEPFSNVSRAVLLHRNSPLLRIRWKLISRGSNLGFRV